MNKPVGPRIRLLDSSSQTLKGQSSVSLPSIVAFIISLAYTLVSLYSYSFPRLGIPAFLRVPRYPPGYMDLRQLTYTSGCSETFSDLLSSAVNCDPWDRPFNYTWSSLKVLRLLGVNGESTELLGGLFGLFSIAISLIFIFSILRTQESALWLSSFFLLSFPFQFSLERGNYELIIFGGSLLVPFVLFSPWFSRFLAARGVIAALLSFSVIALKIHPVAGLAPWALGLAITWPDKRGRWIPILILVLSILGIIIQLGDIPQILSNTPKPDGWISFGLTASYQSILGNGFAIVITIVKAFIVLIATRLMLKASLKPIFEFKSYSVLTEYSRQSALLFSIMLLSIWIISKSWDYRLIFALGILPYFINVYTNLNPNLRNILKVITCCFIFVMFEGFFGGHYQGGRIGVVLAFISNSAVQPALIGFVLAFLLRNISHIAPLRPIHNN